MSMKERSWQDESYRYGFNGKENDADWDVQDYGFRIYKPELGKFLSVDPLTKGYPELTPYQFASNTPIQAIDLDGLEAKKVTGFKNTGNMIIVIRGEKMDILVNYIKTSIHNKATIWDYMVVDNIKEAISVSEDYLGKTKDNKYNNLILSTHGGVSREIDPKELREYYIPHLTLGETSALTAKSAKQFLSYQKEIKDEKALQDFQIENQTVAGKIDDLKSLGNMVKENGTLLFDVCNLGLTKDTQYNFTQIMPQILGDFKYNLFMNIDNSTAKPDDNNKSLLLFTRTDQLRYGWIQQFSDGSITNMKDEKGKLTRPYIINSQIGIKWKR
jgi:RHS repeat-associated protein